MATVTNLELTTQHTRIMDYNSDFKFDFHTSGLKGETWFHQLLEDKKIEVKNEEWLSGVTGNVYIEYQFKGRKSGLATTEADYWAFKLSDERAFIIGTNELKAKIRSLITSGNARSGIKGGDSNLSLGVLVKIKDLI